MGGRCFFHFDGSAILWVRPGCSGSWKCSDGLLTTVHPFSPNLRLVIAGSQADGTHVADTDLPCHGLPVECRPSVIALASHIHFRMGAQPAQHWGPASSLQNLNSDSSQIIFPETELRVLQRVVRGLRSISIFCFPLFCVYLFFILCCSISLLFVPMDVFSPPLSVSFLTASPNPAAFVFKCSNLPCSRGSRSWVNNFACVFSIRLNCTFTVDILL